MFESELWGLTREQHPVVNFSASGIFLRFSTLDEGDQAFVKLREALLEQFGSDVTVEHPFASPINEDELFGFHMIKTTGLCCNVALSC